MRYFSLVSALCLLTTVPFLPSPALADSNPPPPPPPPRKFVLDFTQSHYDPESCGLSGKVRSRRHGGEDYVDGMDFSVKPDGAASRGEMPWAVAIQSNVPNHETRFCAGTLISRRHVVTAAHCLATVEMPVAPAQARCNKTDHFDFQEFMQWSEVLWGGECIDQRDPSCADESMMAKRAKIVKISLFPFFDEVCTGGSDMVVYELDRDVTVPHVCLPHLHDVNFTQQSPFSSFGWGGASKSPSHSSRLQRAQLTLRSDHCRLAWPHLSADVRCFSAQQLIKYCAGNSGSGLLTTIKKRTYIVGVFNSGSFCVAAEDGGEARYTDIRMFTATIDKEIGTSGPLPDFSDLPTTTPIPPPSTSSE